MINFVCQYIMTNVHFQRFHQIYTVNFFLLQFLRSIFMPRIGVIFLQKLKIQCCAIEKLTKKSTEKWRIILLVMSFLNKDLCKLTNCKLLKIYLCKAYVFKNVSSIANLLSNFTHNVFTIIYINNKYLISQYLFVKLSEVCRYQFNVSHRTTAYGIFIWLGNMYFRIRHHGILKEYMSGMLNCSTPTTFQQSLVTQ